MRFFPLNKGIVKGSVKSLIKTIGIYIASNMVLAILVSILDFIPLVKNLLHHVDNVYELYIWVGSLLGIFQYATGVDASQIEFVKTEDVLALWNDPKYKKYILIGTLVLCLVPYSGLGRATSNSPQISNDVVQSENPLLDEAVGVVAPQETDVMNIEGIENVLETEIETEMAVDTEIEEVMPEVAKEVLEFYDEVKGFWQGNDSYCTFLRHGNQYYMLYDIDDKYAFEYYDVISLEKSENGVLATIANEEGISYIVSTKQASNGDKYLEILLENGTSLTEVDDILTYQTCSTYDEFFEYIDIPLRYINKENLEHEYVKLSADSSFAALDIIPELEGVELLVIEDSRDTRYDVWAIQDSIVCPMGYIRCDEGKEKYNPEEQKIYGYIYTGYYNQYVYDAKNGCIKMEKENVEPIGEDIVYVGFGDTFEQYFEEKEKYFAALENQKLDIELMKKLANVERFPDGYTSAAWNNMQVEFDGISLKVGETMLSKVIANGWKAKELEEGNRVKYFDITSKNKKVGHTYGFSLMKDEYYLYRSPEGEVIHEYNPFFNVYDLDEKETPETTEGKKIYYIHFGSVGEREIFQGYERNYPSIALPQGISYHSTREDILNAYGMPWIIYRKVDRASYIYYSEDFMKRLEIEISDRENVVDIIISDKSNTIDKSWIEQLVDFDRQKALEEAKEVLPDLFK